VQRTISLGRKPISEWYVLIATGGMAAISLSTSSLDEMPYSTFETRPFLHAVNIVMVSGRALVILKPTISKYFGFVFKI